MARRFRLLICALLGLCLIASFIQQGLQGKFSSTVPGALFVLTMLVICMVAALRWHGGSTDVG